MIVSCWLRHRFEYSRKSAGEERKVILLFSAFGMPSNRIDTDNLTLCGHNTSAEERAVSDKLKSLLL